MNCPAKNDDSLLKHPTWNQNPSYLAAELTTRQDLNGVANSREHRNADELAGGWFGDQNEILESDSPPGSGGKGGGAEEQLYWLSSIKAAVGSYGHPRLLVASHSPSLQRVWDWVVWLASVIFCSYLLSAFQNSRNPVVTLAPVEGEIGLKVPPLFFFIVRHFGTGVLIATAFVHLLPTAFILLGNPCLSDFWIKDYPAIPGAIALAGVFFVIVIEMVFHPSRHITPQRSASPTISGQPGGILSPLSDTAGQEGTKSVQETRPDGQLSGTQAEADVEKDSDNFSFVLTAEQKLQKDVLQCILLEVGILFHSIFIGMALSVSVGNEFIVLLIAIAFHQTFEGLALGSRIAGIAWPGSTLKPWFMALAYGCTPDSEVGLILVGTMNAISAGLLVFASLVELLSEDFLSYESWRMLRVTRQFDVPIEGSTTISVSNHGPTSYAVQALLLPHISLDVSTLPPYFQLLPF
ncbi:hypothetical protein TWF106_007427 [Orbilia oligospora]|uniref:High-affinity Zn(2+) transporter zrt1 n=1 Tax=Orbilia oligospora TaxID=2813651 RepID=A0A7C8R1C0_ORBOL|nr:hypothetical protein TWF106_007427 [Orbilia oligospora]